MWFTLSTPISFRRSCQVFKKSFCAATLRAFGSTKEKIAVALSGGVDSSVSAYILKKQGHHVEGVYMRNWDFSEEGIACTTEKDRQDAERVCQQLAIPFHEVEFIKEYWTNVFEEVLQDYAQGGTPNPDILCNREIKFKCLLQHVLEHMGATQLATGHYARLRHRNSTTELLRGMDPSKDQSYFLSHVSWQALKNCVFPVGSLQKLKKIAKEAGLVTADKPESMGLCFIGKRKFQDFLGKYLDEREGVFKTFDGTVVGKHQGAHLFTIGQKARIGGQISKYYVVGKNMQCNEVFVTRGDCLTELRCQSLKTSAFHWVLGQPPNELLTYGSMRCYAQVRHRGEVVPCYVRLDEDTHGVYALFEKPLTAVAVKQGLALYLDDELCLGGGLITEVT